MRRTRPKYGRAFTLLEVILALAILGGSIAIIGSLIHHGMRNSIAAAELSQAQMLCETKLAELLAGITPLETATDVPFEFDPLWLYTVRLLPGSETGLIALELSVRPSDAQPNELPTFQLVRWIVDPGVELSEAENAEAQAAAAGSTMQP